MKNINALEPLAYIEPEPIPAKDMEVIDEESVSNDSKDDANAMSSGKDETPEKNKSDGDDDQPTLF